MFENIPKTPSEINTGISLKVFPRLLPEDISGIPIEISKKHLPRRHLEIPPGILS